MTAPMLGPLIGQVVAGILIAAAALTAVGVIGKACWWVWKKILQPLSQLIDDWQGEPKREGISPGRPGVLQRLASLEDGQASLIGLVDLVSRLERRMAAVESRLPSPDGQPRMEAGGMGFQAERASEESDSTVRLSFAARR